MDDELTQARQALASDDYRAQIRAIDVILQHHDLDAVPILTMLLRSKESPVRTAASIALARLADHRDIEALIARMSDSSSQAREYVVESLAAVDHPRVRATLIHAVQADVSWEVRIKAVRALASHSDDATVAALIGALTDADDDVRGAAAIVLGNLGDPRALPALQHMAANDHGEHWWPEGGGWCSTAGTAEQAIEAIIARQNGDAAATMLNRPARQRHRMPDYTDCRKAFVHHSKRAAADDEPFPDEDAPEGLVDRIEVRFYRREGGYRVALGTITVEWYKRFPATSGVIEAPVPRMQVPWEAWGGLAHCGDLLQRLDCSNAPAMQPDEFAALLIECGFEDESTGVRQIATGGWATRLALRVAVNGIPLPTLPGGFPARFLQAAYDLRQQGVAGLAWPYPTILEVVTVLTERGYAILGGDVYQEGERGLTMVAGDNWYINKEADWPWPHYVEESKLKAIAFVEWYHGRFGDAYLYQPVFALTLPNTRT